MGDEEDWAGEEMEEEDGGRYAKRLINIQERRLETCL